jgi:uncharacterized FlaG/YvyC family protein
MAMDISPIDPAKALNPQVQQPAQPQQMAERQQLIQAVKEVNKSEMLGQENELTFMFDRNTRKAVVRVVNKKTNEVVLQIPPEYVLRIAEELKRKS